MWYREEAVSTRVVVLDTSAFFMGYDPSAVDAEHYTTPSVADELREGSIGATRLVTAVNADRLTVRAPMSETLATVHRVSHRLGDRRHLSRTDCAILALTLELQQHGREPILVSDDYAVQNVAAHLDLVYAALTARGIRYRFRWVSSCPVCKRRYPPDYTGATCEVCGARLTRRVVKRTRIACDSNSTSPRRGS
jgi:UPF0271 protein